MLVKLRDIHDLSVQRGHAVGAFHAVNLEQAQGILEAAVEEQAPVVVALDEPGAMYAGFEAFYAMAASLAEQVSVPVALCLDRMHDADLVASGLEQGFSGVMADPRDGDEDKVVETLARIKRECRDRDAFFEASLTLNGGDGTVDEAYAGRLKRVINPDSVCVTVSQDERKVPGGDFFARLEAIAGVIGLPMGLSGVGRWDDPDFKRALSHGIWKVSIATRVNMAFTSGLKDFMAEHPDRINPRGYLRSARDRFRAEVSSRMRVIGSV